MHSISLVRGGAVFFAATAFLAAQDFIEPAPSSRINLPTDPDDEFVFTVTIPNGLSMVFPDGTSTTSIDVSTNGRITPGGALLGVTDFTPTPAELLNGPAVYAPCWTDLISGFIYVDNPASNPTLITVSYLETFDFGNPGDPFSFQLQYDTATNIARVVFDSRAPLLGDGATSVNDGIVGLSAGGGAIDPGSGDLLTGGVATAGPSIYEFFNFDTVGMMTVSTFDLQLFGVDFTPTGPLPAAYLATGAALTADPTFVVGDTAGPGEFVVEARFSCRGGPSFTLSPDGFGEYILLPGALSGFDDTFPMTNLFPGMFINDAQVVAPLSFTFPFPGQTLPAGETQVVVDVDGFLKNGTAGGAEEVPTVAAALAGDAIIAPWWHRTSGVFNGGGTAQNVLVGSETFTWYETQEWAVNAAGQVFINAAVFADTFQVRLNQDGSIEFSYADIDYQGLNFGTQNPGFSEPTSSFIGISPGNNALDPGEVDLTADIAGGVGLSIGGVYYEFFDNDGTAGNPFFFDGFDFDDLPNATVDLVEISAPQIGTNYDVQVNGTGGPMAPYIAFFGFPAGIAQGGVIPEIALGFLGAPQCFLLQDFLTPGFTLGQATGTVNNPVTLFNIPPLPPLVGVTGLTTQALVIDGTLTPTFFTTDELVVTVGI